MPAVLDVLGLAVGRRLVDVGTGTGVFAEAAVDRGFWVEGVDAEPTMMDFARRHSPRPGVLFGVGRVPDLDFPTSSMDAATAELRHHSHAGAACIAEGGLDPMHDFERTVDG